MPFPFGLGGQSDVMWFGWEMGMKDKTIAKMWMGVERPWLKDELDMVDRIRMTSSIVLDMMDHACAGEDDGWEIGLSRDCIHEVIGHDTLARITLTFMQSTGLMVASMYPGRLTLTSQGQALAAKVGEKLDEILAKRASLN